MDPAQTTIAPKRLGMLVVAVVMAHWLALGDWTPIPEATVKSVAAIPRPEQTTQLRTLGHPPATSQRTMEAAAARANSPDATPDHSEPEGSIKNRGIPPEQENKFATKNKSSKPNTSANKPTEPDDKPAASLVIASLTAPPTPASPTEVTPAHQPTPATPPAESVPIATPGSVTLRYDVTAQRKSLNVQADATLELQVAPPRYNARMTLKAWLAGSRIQTSRGTLEPNLGFVPERFGDQNRSKPEQAAHFDRTRQPPAVRFSANAPDAELLPGTQDRLSVLLQLAALLEGRARQTPPKPVVAGDLFRIHTAGTDGAEWWTFKVLEQTTVNLPAGATEALHLRRDPTHAYDNQVELWMAPAMHHLPVRIWWQQANGDVVDQRLTALTHP